VLVAAIGLGLRQLRYKEFDFVGRMFFRGEFNKPVQAALRLEKLRANLETAATDEAWWTALADAARECGWNRLFWDSPNGAREIRFGEIAEFGWTLTVSAREKGSLHIEGSGNRKGMDLSDFAEVVRKSVRAAEHDSTPAQPE
jgi:hypothetical protein